MRTNENRGSWLFSGISTHPLPICIIAMAMIFPWKLPLPFIISSEVPYIIQEDTHLQLYRICSDFHPHFALPVWFMIKPARHRLTVWKKSKVSWLNILTEHSRSLVYSTLPFLRSACQAWNNCMLGQVLFPKWTFLPFNISLLPRKRWAQSLIKIKSCYIRQLMNKQN